MNRKCRAPARRQAVACPTSNSKVIRSASRRWQGWPVAPTRRGHSCLQRRDSGLLISWNFDEPILVAQALLPAGSRLISTLFVRGMVGRPERRDESRRCRHECPRHVGLKLIPRHAQIMGWTSGVQRLISAPNFPSVQSRVIQSDSRRWQGWPVTPAGSVTARCTSARLFSDGDLAQ